MAKKNYCLDTNILLHNPESIYKFEDNDVYIPYQVIEELDKFKTERTERGYNARRAIRHFSDLREMGNLMKGIKLEGGGKLFILYNKDDSELPFSERIKLPEGFSRDKMDNQILLNVKNLQLSTKKKTILVTNDANMQIKADIMDILSQEYRNDRVNSADFEAYGGRSVRYVSDDYIDQFCSMKEKGVVITPPESDSMDGLMCNEFVNLKSWENKSVLAKYNGVSFEKLWYSEMTPHPCGLTPRNMGQRFLMEALLSPHTEHPLTIVNGPAGTGKTLCLCAQSFIIARHRIGLCSGINDLFFAIIKDIQITHHFAVISARADIYRQTLTNVIRICHITFQSLRQNDFILIFRQMAGCQLYLQQRGIQISGFNQQIRLIVIC